jgi:hypothetical protein
MSIKSEKAQAALAARARAKGIPEWQQEMIEALSGNVLGDIVADNRASRAPSSIIPTSSQGPSAPTVGNGRGWIDPPPVKDWKPPGQDIIDAMLDAAAAQDRAELEKKLKR